MIDREHDLPITKQADVLRIVAGSKKKKKKIFFFFFFFFWSFLSPARGC